MKALFFAVFLSLGALTAQAYDNSIPCGELIGQPEFWECIAGSNVSLVYPASCGDLIGKPEFWDCIAGQNLHPEFACGAVDSFGAHSCSAE